MVIETQQLRQRSTVVSTTTNQNNNKNKQIRMMGAISGGTLTIDSMLTASPQNAGSVQKLHSSIIFFILPSFIQNIILKYWCFSFLRPKWKSRFLILLGSYLYKFQDPDSSNKDEFDNKKLQKEPKGSPIDIKTIDVHLVSSSNIRSEDDATVLRLAKELLMFPNTTTTTTPAVICVSTLRKRQYYACETEDDAITWINSIREARQEAITRSLGHANHDSYPSSWEYYDRLGQKLERTKDRIREKIENYRELEMSNLTDGGPSPRGYYG